MEPAPSMTLSSRLLAPSRRAATTLRGVGFAAAVCIAAVASTSPAAHAGGPLPQQFEAVDVKNKLGEKVDRDLALTDHTGRSVKLGDYLDGTRPVILTLNYYRCTSMCSAQLNELLDAVKNVGWIPGGDEFQMLTVSFDPRDDTEIARGKRMTYLRELAAFAAAEDGDDAPTPEQLEARADTLGWTFATATPEVIRALTEQVGYEYFYDEPSGQYAHSPVIYVLSPEGVISRYLHGITYPPRDLRFALMEASDGSIGSFGEKVLLSCFAFDPDSGGYHAFAWGFMRIGGLLIVLIIGICLAILFYRERRSRRNPPGLTGSSLPGSAPAA